MTSIVSYDPAELKSSLIQFLQSKESFEDFNYEGSALNTIIDTLVRNTHYIAYMANMVATESFCDSAQLRANVVSHAQKLSYVPKSKTASTIIVDLEVIPAVAPSAQVYAITANKGSVFIATVGNDNFQFTNTSEIVLYKTSTNRFKAVNVELKQGQLSKQQFLFTENGNIEIENADIDTSTLRVFIRSSEASTDQIEYLKVSNITDVETDSRVFYLSENTKGNFIIEFGKNVLGKEPETGAVITIEYVSTESNHANGLSTLFAATPIEGYSNIVVTVTTAAYGGSEKDSIDFIKFISPKVYASQERAVREQDYQALILKEFSFIKSAIVWGGEKNIPPYYGTVFISAIPHTGFVIAPNVKSIIENKLKQYSMMRTTVIDANFIGLDLNIDVIFDSNSTTETYSIISAQIKSIIDEYNNSLKTFDLWFNNSYLSKMIVDRIPSIVSVEISTTSFNDITIQQNKFVKYEIEFLNRLKPGSFVINDISLDVLATEQSIEDDSNGNIVKKITINDIENITTIGTIDYQTGKVQFSAMILNSGTMRCYADPFNLNFYTERNYITYINNTTINRISERR